MRSNEVAKIDWKARVKEDYFYYDDSIFSNPIWGQFHFDFEGMHKRLQRWFAYRGAGKCDIGSLILFSGNLKALQHGLQSGEIKLYTHRDLIFFAASTISRPDGSIVT